MLQAPVLEGVSFSSIYRKIKNQFLMVAILRRESKFRGLACRGGRLESYTGSGRIDRAGRGVKVSSGSYGT